MDQGTEKWHEWRKAGQGSSDAPVIMGVSPYKTPYQLYLEKLGLNIVDEKKEAGKKFIFEKGHKIEAEARAHREVDLGFELLPKLYAHKDITWLIASMDGANDEHSYADEYKLVSKAEYEAGVCPDRYYPQVQHQYVVSGLKTINIVLCMHEKNEDGKSKLLKKVVHVPVDLKYIEKLLKAHVEFRECVQKKTPPELTAKDAIKVKDNELKKLITQYKKNLARIEKVAAIEKENEELKKLIFEKATHPFMVHGKVSIKSSVRKGAVDYDKFFKEKKIDIKELEAFRKDSTITKAIKCN